MKQESETERASDGLVLEHSSLNSRKPICVKNDHVRGVQQLHASAAIIVPFVGTMLAFGHSLRYGIGILEVALFSLMYLITMVGITVGFHRHFTHGAFQASRGVRAALAIAGCMAFQGPLIYWVSNHRLHHQFGDKGEDLHSPHVRGKERLGKLQGLWHSHAGWTINHPLSNVAIFAPDLLKDTLILFINRRYYLWVLLGLVVPTVLGGLISFTWDGCYLGLLWGGFVRLFFSYHFTNSVNSITHLYGERSFETRDHSTNNVWLAVPTLGEAWHNNHHAFPSSATFNIKWWQIDLGGWLIVLLEKAGLVWDVKRPSLSKYRPSTQKL